MRTATVRVKSLTPYSQSKALESEKKKGETHDDFDKRIWPEHIHADADGQVFIPPMALIEGMGEAAAYLSKGGELKKKGQATWSQNFQCGLAVAEGARIGIAASDARSERVFCHSNGKRGTGTRVWRTFPVFDSWEAEFVIHILDDTIPEEVFNRVMVAFGMFIGIGRFRPQNRGYLGRFVIEKISIA